MTCLQYLRLRYRAWRGTASELEYTRLSLIRAIDRYDDYVLNRQIDFEEYHQPYYAWEDPEANKLADKIDRIKKRIKSLEEKDRKKDGRI